MCCIAFHPAGIPADEAALRNIAEVDSDYHGYALATPGGKLLTDKSSDADYLIRNFLLLQSLYPQSAAVWHSRLSTGSANTEANGQPVICGNETVVVHNGQLSAGTQASDDPRSDTVVFAQDLFPAFASLDDPYVFSLLEEWAGPYNKLAFLTTNKRYAENAYIVSRGQWITTPEGILYSNPEFLGRGTGWDEVVRDGDLYRWRVLQDGQCPDCHLYGCASLDAPGTGCQRKLHARPPAWRNETQRRAQVAAAGRTRM